MFVDQYPVDDARPRSPSPPPEYDENGKRTNTREMRNRKRLQQEKARLVEEAGRTNPLFKTASAEMRPRTQRKSIKIYLPVDENPSTNFIGLLIGPRGTTLKQMEAESGTKIAIRGKGSIKEGKPGFMTPRMYPGDDDELHVLITGETDEQLNKATELVNELLAMGPNGESEHKKAQLRRLAAINGTLRDEEYEACKWCGSFLHRHWNCTNKPRESDNVCSLCKKRGHFPEDCPLRADNRDHLDKELDHLMTELGMTPDTAESANKPSAPAAGITWRPGGPSPLALLNGSPAPPSASPSAPSTPSVLPSASGAPGDLMPPPSSRKLVPADGTQPPWTPGALPPVPPLPGMSGAFPPFPVPPMPGKPPTDDDTESESSEEAILEDDVSFDSADTMDLLDALSDSDSDADSGSDADADSDSDDSSSDE